MSAETNALFAEPYILVIGPTTRPRPWLAAVEQATGSPLAVRGPADVFSDRHLVCPRAIVLDGGETREERERVQERLQTHPKTCGTPVAVLADDGDIDSFSGAITKGAAAFLVQPADPFDMADVMRRLSRWDTQWARTEKRRRVRRPILIRVSLEVRERAFRTPGLMVDVSSTGCRVEVTDPAHRGEEASLTLHAYDKTTGIALGGTVVRWERPAENGLHTVALRFSGGAAMMAARLLGAPVPGA